MGTLLDKLPKLIEPPLKNLCESEFRLDMFDRDIQLFVIEFIHSTLSNFFRNDQCFGVTRDEQDQCRNVWISGLCDLTVLKIMNGLYEILSCRTNYVDFPPRTPMAFHKICKSINYLIVDDFRKPETFLLENFTGCDRKKKLAAVTCAIARKPGKYGPLFSEPNGQENLIEQLIFCVEHDKYYLEDVPCSVCFPPNFKIKKL